MIGRREDGEHDDIAWDRLSWNPSKERVEYDEVPFENAHMIFQIRPTRERDTDAQPAAARPAETAAPRRRRQRN